MKPAVRYRVSSRFSERGFVESLDKDFTVSEEPPVSRRETYLDTFDWRFFEEALTLSYEEGRLALRRLSTGEDVETAEIPAPPRFAGDLPKGGLRDLLLSITDVRALLPLFETELRALPVRILDRREKTAVRIEVEEVRVVSASATGSCFRHVSLKPVQGYDKHAEGVGRWLEASGYAREDGDLFTSLCKAAGKSPGAYTSKLRFTLDPAMGAYDALVRIFRFLAGVIRENEEGVRRDIDTEFLHDWRVATRRTRAGLGQMRKVVPKAVGKRFRKEFADFGEKTNRLRDLDVYLLKAEEYRALLPEEIRGDIDPLFDYVREERARELGKVQTWLDSNEYEEPLAEWEKFIHEPLADAGARSESRVPIIELASRTIRARYGKVAERGARAASNPDDAKLHLLRIQCKKLRYLLEFFSNLYPADEITRLIKQLKLLQDNLGRHQDISVQQAGLRAFAEELSSVREGSERTAVAVGALIGALEDEKQDLRSVFGGVFGRFASAENARLVGELFGGGSGRGDEGRDAP